MKNSIFIGLFLFTALTSPKLFGQENLIPNGHFDDNISNYGGGNDPVDWYTANQNCTVGRERFENEVDHWFVAKSDAHCSQLSNGCPFPTRRCSPDWIPGWTYDFSTSCNEEEQSYYISHGLANESVMVQMIDNYKLIKGRTYKFKTKVRSARGSGNFQLVFSSKEKGLRVNNVNKWTAGSFQFDQGCTWQNIEYFFTVPEDDNHNYEEMKYLILQYNNEQARDSYGAKVALHYDDVFLCEGDACPDIKYIQSWQYNQTAGIISSFIKEANIHIYAGSNVSPYAWDEIGPVIVKEGAEVIYRAPNITLSNGFEVEEGAYFETQNGECTGDPCPEITPYNPGTLDLCDDELTLGESLDQEAGIFYEWQPSQYFSNPTSAVTQFIKPEGNGCFEGILKIRTICDEEESFPFTINYHDAPADIDVFNVLTNAENLEFDVNIVNANSYTIQVINTDDNSVIYENSDGVSCGTIDLSEQISLTPCTHNLCGNIDVSITADNQCFDSQEESLSFSYPQPPNPIIEIDNIVSGDYEFSFDVVNIPDEMEYITFQVFNGANELQCSATIDACDDPNLTEYHFDVESCTCLTYCDNHMVKISMKNRCNDNIAYQTLNWNATSSEIIVPWWPNAITMNNDGINDCLWFEPQGADTYEIFVVNQWGNLMYESTGCVDDIPICLWIPQSNITSAVYFYTVVFSNGCGQSVSNTTFVHVYNFGGMITNPNGEMPRDQMSQEHYENLNLNQIQELEERITLFPNPANESVTIQGIPMPVMVNILDTKGKTLLHEESAMGQIDLLNLASGVYFVQIYIGNRSIMKEFIKQ